MKDFIYILLLVCCSNAMAQGNTCNNPVIIDSSIELQGFIDSTCGSGDDYSLNNNNPNLCSYGGFGPFGGGVAQADYLDGQDQVYTITSDVNTCFAAILVANDNDAGIHLFGECPSNSNSVDCLDFDDVSGNNNDGFSEAIVTYNLEPFETYYLVISSDGGCIDYELDVLVNPVLNDFCEDAVPLDGFASNYCATNTGENENGWTPDNSAFASFCPGGNWSVNHNGVWFTFSIDELQDVSIDIFNIECYGAYGGFGGGSDDLLQVGVWTNTGTCDLSVETLINCIVAVGTATLNLYNLPAGDYYLFADGSTGSDCTWEFASELICDVENPVPDFIDPLCELYGLPDFLTADEPLPNNTLNWYSSDPSVDVNAEIIGTGTEIPFPTDLISTIGTYTLYLQNIDEEVENCESEIIAFPLEILDAPFPNIDLPEEFCSNGGVVNLTTYEDPNFSGTWYVNDIALNTLNPLLYTDIVFIEFLADDFCIAPYGNLFDIIPAETIETPDPVLLCEDDAETNLDNYISGSWAGSWNGTMNTDNIFLASGNVGNHIFNFIPEDDCVEGTSLEIEVEAIVIGDISTPQTFCIIDDIIDLNDFISNNVSGTWSGNNVVNNEIALNLMTVGQASFTFEPLANCFETGLLEIDFIATEQAFNDLDISVCQTSGLVNLDVYNSNNNPGNWVGNNTTNSQFDPSGLSGNYVLSFEPTETCFIPSTVTITVTSTVEPNLIAPDLICNNDGTIDLSIYEDVNFTGNWSGQNVVNNTLDPIGLVGSYNLTFDPIDECATTVILPIEIEDYQMLNLTLPDQICATDSVVQLDVVTGNTSGGEWQGDGVNNGVFDPSNLLGIIAINFVPQEPCIAIFNGTIEVTSSGIPQLGILPYLCQGESNIDLSTFSDVAVPGEWIGTVITNSILSLNNSGSYNISYVPDDSCDETVIIPIEIHSSALLTIINSNCISTDEFMLEFEISGEDNDVYSIDIAGIQVDGIANNTASTIIIQNSNTPYDVTFSNQENCGDVVEIIPPNCECPSANVLQNIESYCGGLPFSDLVIDLEQILTNNLAIDDDGLHLNIENVAQNGVDWFIANQPLPGDASLQESDIALPNGCEIAITTIYGFLRCDLSDDGFALTTDTIDDSYIAMGEVIIEIYPALNDLQLEFSSDVCCPQVTSFECENHNDYTISNSIDDFGGEPNCENLYSDGVLSFTITRVNPINDQICDERIVEMNYSCPLECPEIIVEIIQNEIVICETDINLNLNDFLGGNTDVNGQWTRMDSGAAIDAVITIADFNVGNTTLRYVVNPPLELLDDCEGDEANIELVVVAQQQIEVIQPVSEICVDIVAFNSFDLFSTLGNTSGVWYDSSNNEIVNGILNFTGLDNGTYDFRFELVDETGTCPSISASVQVQLINCFEAVLLIPTAFSPNNDALNDIFRMFGDGIVTLEYEIYNRWGELVFKATDDKQEWDGTNELEPCENGVYVFQARAEFINGVIIERQGNITLLY